MFTFIVENDIDGQIPGNLPSILALACSNDTNSIAAGTEFANHQASIIIWYSPLPP